MPETHSPKKIVITGGGTGGHVFPALAIADELSSRGIKLLYVGTENGMEAKLVPDRGIPFFALRTGSVKNQSVFKIVKTLFQLVLAILWGLRFLHREKPDAVIGVGGYVSVPLCVAAFLSRIPVYLQEQNVSVGIANRFLGRLSKKVFLGFDQAKVSFAKRKVVVTGNPIRKEFSASNFPDYRSDARCLVILGGSQGALALNEVVASLLEEIQERLPGLRIVHQTGKKDWEKISGLYRTRYSGDAEVMPFITDMADTYAKASLVVSRSGALTVSELIQVGRPAIFVPYPRQGQNDQTANAYWLKENGAAQVVEQGENFRERFRATLFETYQEDKLTQMAANYCRLRTGGALATIGDQITQDLAF